MIKGILSFTLFVLVIALFWTTSNFEFLNFDDPTYVVRNPHVVSGITLANIRWAFTESYGGHWHPLSWISHMIDCSLFGVNPGPHHVVNVVLHGINTMLVFLLFAALLADLPLAVLCALIFGVHPMRIESVVWISERKDVLSMLFGLLAIHCYLLRVQRERLVATAGVFIFFILSLLAKPTFVTLPLMLLLIDWWPLKRFDRRACVEKIPLVLISIAMSLIAMYAQHREGGLKTLGEISLSARLSIVWLGYGAYLGKFFAPFSIGLFYPFQIVQPGFGLGAFMGFMAVAALLWSNRDRYPGLLMGWMWFVVALLPMIGFLPIGGQSYADRWSYLSHLGLIVGCASYLQIRWRKYATVLLGCFATLCAGLTIENLPQWKDSVSIFTHTLNVSPDNFMAHTNLGTAYDSLKRLDLAKVHFEEALRLNPTYPEALNNVGLLRVHEGKLEEARELFQRAIEINPSLILVRYNLGLLYNNLQMFDRALVEWITVLSIDPSHQSAAKSVRYALSVQRGSVCLSLKGRGGEALTGLLKSWLPPAHLVDIKDELQGLLQSCT